MGRSGAATLALATLLCGACASGTTENNREFGAACRQVRATAKTASETGVRLRQEHSTDGAAIESSARSYVTAVRSRPECFTDGQRENAEEIAKALREGQQK